MINLLNPNIISYFHGIYYRARFLINYIVIGLLSIIIELTVQNQLINFGINIYASIMISIFIGIIFAFFGNIYFNFKIPNKKRNQAFKYFVFISISSALTQWLIINNINFISWTYQKSRLSMSGSMFIIGYLLHRKFSFRDRKKVGVAIYANGVEDVQEIHKKIGTYLDFIHVDIIDKTMNEDAKEINTYRMEAIKAYWPDKEIHTHIMSKKPSLYIDTILPYTDIIFIHPECDEKIITIHNKVKKSGKKFGLALSLETDIAKIKSYIELSDNILFLAIKDPGVSGQKFEIESLDKIKLINNHPSRSQFSLCIDGGVNEDIVTILKAEDIVSGSSVLNNINPKKQIMRLQTASRYGAF
mgnify:CR=1 FL=1